MIKQVSNGLVVEEAGNIHYLLDNVTAAGNGPIAAITPRFRSYDVILTGTGAVTATVLIKATNAPSNASNFKTLKTFTLSDTDRTTDGFQSDVPWAYMQAEVTAITGTIASVDCILGV